MKQIDRQIATGQRPAIKGTDMPSSEQDVVTETMNRIAPNARDRKFVNRRLQLAINPRSR